LYGYRRLITDQLLGLAYIGQAMLNIASAFFAITGLQLYTFYIANVFPQLVKRGYIPNSDVHYFVFCNTFRQTGFDICLNRIFHKRKIAAGSAIIFGAPVVQILNPQRGASDQEIEGAVPSYEGRENTDTASSE